MALLSKAAILAAEDLPSEDIAVPEWGGTVRVRGLTGTERDAFEAGMVELRGKAAKVDLHNLRARLVALSVIGEDGQRLFTDNEAVALGKKSAVALQRVFDVARRLSGLTEGDVEELVKN